MLGEGISALMREGKWEEAVVACQSCLQIQPCLGRIHALMGECYYQQKAFDSAEPCFKRAYTLDPQLGDAGSRHAQCLERLHRYREAMDVVKEWLMVKPNDPTLHGLFEFLQTQPDAEEHDGWERTRRMGVTIVNAGFKREEPPSVRASTEGDETKEAMDSGSTPGWQVKTRLQHNVNLG
jgi:tetratricopeptide (TPR) repeat protein